MPYFIFISSLIMPIYTLAFAMIQCIRRKTSYLSIFSISLAFATVAFTLIPSEELDLYRHYERIESIKSLPFQSIISSQDSSYLIFDSYAWLVNYLNLPKEFFTATVVLLAYFLVLSVFNHVKNRFLYTSNTNIVAISFLIFLLGVDFIYLSTGIRNILANTIIFYSAYRAIFDKKLILFILGCILAFYIHPGSIIPAIIVLVALMFPRVSRYAKPLVVMATVLMLGNKLVAGAIEYIGSLASNLPFYSATYLDLDSQWGAAYKEYASARGLIATFVINRLPTYVGLVYLLISKPRDKDPLYTILCISMIVFSLFFSYQTLFSRLNFFYINIFGLFIVLECVKNKNKLTFYFMITYLFSLIGIWLLNIFSFNEYLFSSIEYLYKPLVFILAGI